MERIIDVQRLPIRFPARSAMCAPQMGSRDGTPVPAVSTPLVCGRLEQDRCTNRFEPEGSPYRLWSLI
jgi:hypothetical protein